MYIHRSRNSMIKFFLALGSVMTLSHQAYADITEAYCTIRTPNSRLDCLWVEKNVRRKMTSQDISNFIDQSQISAYMTVKSRAGLERVFQVDAEAPSFKHLRAIEKTASISDIIKAKSDLFTEIEAKVVKLSDDLDSQASAAELVKYDPSISVDKAKLEQHSLIQEVENYRKSDAVYISQQQTTAGGATGSSMLQSKHRITLGYENVGYGGNFSKNGSQSGFNSIDNKGADLAYQLKLSQWIFEAETESYTAYSNFNKGATGGIFNFAGSDSAKSINSLALRSNYCYGAGATQICPGLELNYDQFPVMSFKTLTFTGSNPNASSVLEMQSVTDLTAGANVFINFPLYLNISSKNRIGYLAGTGGLTSSPNKVKSNSGYYIGSQVEWPMWQGFAMNFGLEYLARTASFETSVSSSGITTTVDNTGISQFTSKLGLVWLWGDN